MLLPSLLSVQFQLRCRAKFSGRSSDEGVGDAMSYNRRRKYDWHDQRAGPVAPCGPSEGLAGVELVGRVWALEALQRVDMREGGGQWSPNDFYP